MRSIVASASDFSESCTWTCRIKCVPPLRSKPKLMLSDMFWVIASHVGVTPTTRQKQSANTATTKAIFSANRRSMQTVRCAPLLAGLLRHADDRATRELQLRAVGRDA